MTTYNTYDHILTNADDKEAIETARHMVWNEMETREQTIAYGRYIETVDGIDVFYDYGADYYFFCPAV